ncbi:MAG: MinD/ParA family protein [Gammaproteobacteria bacterium]|nr:MinD/ParA family protein [Gammaproteobacteria bacterium]
MRRLTQPRPVRVIAITSGKGGVGKTNVSVNLAAAMAQSGKQVMLLDADLGLANVDVMLGLHPQFNLSHVLRGERTLEEIVVDAADGFKVVPAASGVKDMIEIGAREHAGLVRAFSELVTPLDVLLIDTAAGLSDGVITFTRAAQEVVVVVCDEPASITDAYALIKVLSRDYGHERFRVLANMTRTMREGYELFGKIVRVTDKYLSVSLDYMGSIPHDDFLRQAVQRQRTVTSLFPASRASQAFKKLAAKVDNWPVPAAPSGHVEFFVERLVNARREGRGAAV